MAELNFGPTYITKFGLGTMHATALLPLALRDTHQVVVDVALPRGFLCRQRLDLPEALLEAHQIRAALRVEVVHDVGEPLRQLTLLPPFALVEQRMNLLQQRAAIHVRRDRRGRG